MKVGNGGSTRARRRVSLSMALMFSAVSVLAALLASAAPTSAVVAEVVVADLRVSGTIEQGPPGGGVTTLDEMRYQMTLTNRGPDAIPARSVLIAISVPADGGQALSTIEVSGLNGPVVQAPGGDCGVGRRQQLRCINRQEIGVDQQITIVVGHRHPAAEAGQLSFAFNASPLGAAYEDGNPGNNGYGGPGYVFVNAPTTTTIETTTTLPATTVVETTSTDPDASTSSIDPNASTSSTEATDTTVESTTTTEATTTTTAAPTTTTTAAATTIAPPTTLESTTTIAAMADGDATLTDQSSSSMLGATGETEDPAAGDDEVVLGPTAEDDGGPPILLFAGIFAVLLLIGGVGLALYAHYNRPPPLVDIRQFH